MHAPSRLLYINYCVFFHHQQQDCSGVNGLQYHSSTKPGRCCSLFLENIVVVEPAASQDSRITTHQG